MGRKIYHVSGPNNTSYFPTKESARRFFRQNEGDYDSWGSLDAVEECERLRDELSDVERERIRLLVTLKGLVAIAPRDTLTDTHEGREAVKLLKRLDPEFIKDCRLDTAE